MSMLNDETLRKLIPRLRRFAYSLTRDLDSADDLVQSCLERALETSAQRRPDGELRAWLFTILYRQFIDSRRRQSRLGKLLSVLQVGHDTDSDEAPGPSTDDLFEAHEQLAVFAQLSPEQRAILLLVAVEGLTYQAISAQLGIPLGTVMSRVSRARQAFRQLTENGRAEKVTQPTLRVLNHE